MEDLSLRYRFIPVILSVLMIAVIGLEIITFGILTPVNETLFIAVILAALTAFIFITVAAIAFFAAQGVVKPAFIFINRIDDIFNSEGDLTGRIMHIPYREVQDNDVSQASAAIEEMVANTMLFTEVMVKNSAATNHLLDSTETEQSSFRETPEYFQDAYESESRYENYHADSLYINADNSFATGDARNWRKAPVNNAGTLVLFSKRKRHL